MSNVEMGFDMAVMLRAMSRVVLRLVTAVGDLIGHIRFVREWFCSQGELD